MRGYTVVQSSSEMWHLLRSREGKEVQYRINRVFEHFFPDGHRTSLREFIAFYLGQDARGRDESWFEYLTDITDEALYFLLDYGTDYVPMIWPTQPMCEPIHAECFNNAVCCMGSVGEVLFPHNSPHIYVEGLAFGGAIPPMVHAWNTFSLDDDTAVDWTHYAVCTWTRYIGVPITLTEYQSIADKLFSSHDRQFSLFHREYFEKTKPLLLSLLEARKSV